MEGVPMRIAVLAKQIPVAEQLRLVDGRIEPDGTFHADDDHK